MKLIELQEARLAYPNYGQWVKDIIEDDSYSYREAIKKIPESEIDAAVASISKYYGKPFRAPPDIEKKSYLLWQNKTGANPRYNIVVWNNGDLIIERKNTDYDLNPDNF